MGKECWLATLTCNPSAETERVANALAEKVGARRVSGPCAGPGVILFETYTPEVRAFLADTTAVPTARVLAVSLCALPPGEAWGLLAQGAADVTVFSGDLSACLERIAARLNRWAAIEEIVSSPLVTQNLVGKSPTFLHTVRQLIELARFTTAPVLLLGESGTGKELAARLVHALDTRPNKRELVVVDCTTLVAELSGSELFGHERGAFTGAASARDGACALADGGTLFLDEVGELPLNLQAQLLRVVQERTFKRVGGNSWLKTDFRLVCATNRDLLEEVARGNFRRDLYYRIAGAVCKMPSLAERVGDILLLAQHFWKTASTNLEVPPFDEDVKHQLLSRHYAGNVRDLRQLVIRMSYRYSGLGPVSVGDVPDDERPSSEVFKEGWQKGQLESAVRRALSLGVGLKEIGRVAEDLAVQLAVCEEEGNLQRAASRLGVTDRALQMRRAQRRAD